MRIRLWRDFDFGLRVLWGRPAFALAAALTLALGIGANTLVFTLIDGVYLNALPYKDAQALVDIHATSAQFGGGVDNVSIPDYVDVHSSVPALADSALYADASFNLVLNGAPERLSALRATPSLFPTLGVEAALGRVFNAEDGTPGHDRVVLLSDTVWRNRFNADATIVGRDLRLDGAGYRVIGVLPPHFMFPRAETGLFVPFAFEPGQLADDQRGVNYSSIVARLAPGATLAQVDAQAAALVQRNTERIGPDASGESYAQWVASTGFRLGVRPLREQLRGSNAGELLVLQVAVALVLLIALANVANLLLARVSARQAELAVRRALGASGTDIARQLIAEALTLGSAGSLLGCAAAWFGVHLVVESGLLPAWVQYSIDARTVAFTVGVTLLASLVFGMLPALAAVRVQPQNTLREAGRLAGGGRAARRVRATLVVLQVALAIALLAGAGLLLRSFANAANQSPGFDSDHVLTAHLTLPAAKYPDAAAQARGVRAMLDALRAQPGVEAAGVTTKLPFGGENAGIVFRIQGRADDVALPHAAWRSVDDAFFSALRIPLLHGRTFDSSDWSSGAHRIVVDAAFEKRYFPGGDAVGQHIYLGSAATGDAYEVIGVVGAVKHWDLTAAADKPTFYFDFGARPAQSAFVALRTAGDPGALVPAMRAAVRAVDAEQPLFSVSTLEQRINASLTGRRVPVQLLGLFAACALLLAAVGIYAVLAFSIEQRTAEFGLRMAIGASAARMRRGVLADGAQLLGIGATLGLLGAIAIGYLLKTRLFNVAPIDAGTLALVAAVVVLTGLMACWLPARRAARLDPLVALRHE